MVRAKFKVDEIKTTLWGKYDHETKTSTPVEMRTLVLSPVHSDKPGSENKKFWDASPSGRLELGCVNPEAWKHFELGAEYYLDFTKADQ